MRKLKNSNVERYLDLVKEMGGNGEDQGGEEMDQFKGGGSLPRFQTEGEISDMNIWSYGNDKGLGSLFSPTAWNYLTWDRAELEFQNNVRIWNKYTEKQLLKGLEQEKFDKLKNYIDDWKKNGKGEVSGWTGKRYDYEPYEWKFGGSLPKAQRGKSIDDQAERKWLIDWINARKETGRFEDQLIPEDLAEYIKNIKTVQQITRDQHSQLFPESVNNSGYLSSPEGLYTLDTEEVGLDNPKMHHYYSDPTLLQMFTNMFDGLDSESSTKIHELTHAMTRVKGSTVFQEMFPDAGFKDYPITQAIKNIPIGFDEWYDDKSMFNTYEGDPEEILAQLMEYRKNFNVDPNRIFTKDDIKEVKKNVDKLGPSGLFGLDIFTPENVIRLLNEVASVEDDLPEGTMRAKYGGSLPKAQSSIETDIINANIPVDEWSKKYHQSDNFKGLAKGYNIPQNIIDQRVKSVMDFNPQTDITFDTNANAAGMTYNSGTSMPDGTYIPTMGPFDNEGKDMVNYNTEKGPPFHPMYLEWENLAAHELLGHVGMLDEDYFGKEMKNILRKLGKGSVNAFLPSRKELDMSRKDYKDMKNHMKDNLEMRANLMQLRYKLAKEGVYDSTIGTAEGGDGTNPFTDEHLLEIYENTDEGWKIKDEWQRNELFQFMAPQDIKWMMNNVADASEEINQEIGDNIPPIMKARYGGQLPKAQSNLETEYSLSQQGHHPMDDQFFDSYQDRHYKCGQTDGACSFRPKKTFGYNTGTKSLFASYNPEIEVPLFGTDRLRKPGGLVLAGGVEGRGDLNYDFETNTPSFLTSLTATGRFGVNQYEWRQENQGRINPITGNRMDKVRHALEYGIQGNYDLLNKNIGDLGIYGKYGNIDLGLNYNIPNKQVGLNLGLTFKDGGNLPKAQNSTEIDADGNIFMSQNTPINQQVVISTSSKEDIKIAEKNRKQLIANSVEIADGLVLFKNEEEKKIEIKNRDDNKVFNEEWDNTLDKFGNLDLSKVKNWNDEQTMHFYEQNKDDYLKNMNSWNITPDKVRKQIDFYETDWLWKNVSKPFVNTSLWLGETAVNSFSDPVSMATTVGGGVVLNKAIPFAGGLFNKIKNSKYKGQSATHTYNPKTKSWIENNANSVRQKILDANVEIIVKQNYLTNKINTLQQNKIKIIADIKKFKLNNIGSKQISEDLLHVQRINTNQLIAYNKQLNNIAPTYTNLYNDKKWVGETLKSSNDNIIKGLNAELKLAEEIDLKRLVGDYKWDNRNIFKKYFDTPKHPFNINEVMGNTGQKPYWIDYKEGGEAVKHTIVKGDTGKRLKAMYGAELKDILKHNDLKYFKLGAEIEIPKFQKKGNNSIKQKITNLFRTKKQKKIDELHQKIEEGTYYEKPNEVFVDELDTYGDDYNLYDMDIYDEDKGHESTSYNDYVKNIELYGIDVANQIYTREGKSKLPTEVVKSNPTLGFDPHSGVFNTMDRLNKKYNVGIEGKSYLPEGFDFNTYDPDKTWLDKAPGTTEAIEINEDKPTNIKGSLNSGDILNGWTPEFTQKEYDFYATKDTWDPKMKGTGHYYNPLNPAAAAGFAQEWNWTDKVHGDGLGIVDGAWNYYTGKDNNRTYDPSWRFGNDVRNISDKTGTNRVFYAGEDGNPVGTHYTDGTPYTQRILDWAGENTDQNLAMIDDGSKIQKKYKSGERTLYRDVPIAAAVATAPLWAPALGAGLATAGEATYAAALPYTTATIGGVEGLTLGNLGTAASISYGGTHLGPDAKELYNNPSWGNLANVGIDLLSIAGIKNIPKVPKVKVPKVPKNVDKIDDVIASKNAKLNKEIGVDDLYVSSNKIAVSSDDFVRGVTTNQYGIPKTSFDNKLSSKIVKWGDQTAAQRNFGSQNLKIQKGDISVGSRNANIEIMKDGNKMRIDLNINTKSGLTADGGGMTLQTTNKPGVFDIHMNMQNPKEAYRSMKYLEEFIPKGSTLSTTNFSTDSYKLMINRLRNNKFTYVDDGGNYVQLSQSGKAQGYGYGNSWPKDEALTEITKINKMLEKANIPYKAKLGDVLEDGRFNIDIPNVMIKYGYKLGGEI